MDYLKFYIVTNFIFLYVALVLIVVTIQRYKQHPKLSAYLIAIIALDFILTIITLLQLISSDIASVELATVVAMLGYSLRPVCIYLFIFMVTTPRNKYLKYYALIPLVLNALLYIGMFIPGLKEYIVYYVPNEDGSAISFNGGPLRFSSHLISLIYLGVLVYISLFKLRAKHLGHGLAVLFCAVFVILAVVIESFFNSNNEVYLLNPTIAVSAMVYYLYLYVERTQFDTLTGLFSRETYYRDIPKMDKSITGVIELDMNGLKYINDKYGHFEGDKAIATIAECIQKSINRSMYAYRLGGDEFLIFVTGGDEELLTQTVDKFKTYLKITKYHCSIGYAYRKNRSMNITDLMKQAEEAMYRDKEEFYKDAKFERRKV